MRQVSTRAGVMALLVGVTVGCGVGDGGRRRQETETFTDGTRLVARYYAFPGTERLFVGIYDRQAGGACEFRAATDGRLRCMPMAPLPLEPAEQWVEGVQAPDTTTAGRLQRHQVESADGGRFPERALGDLYDVQYANPCVPRVTVRDDGSGDGFCLPPYAIDSELFFADAACTERLASATDDGPAPLLVLDQAGAFHAVGAPFEGPAFTSQAPGGCAPAPDYPFAYVRIGGTLPDGAVAKVQLVPRGTGRLALQIVEAQGQSLTTARYYDSAYSSDGDGPYFDRDLAILCRPVLTVDGEARCLPADAVIATESSLTNFADPACTQPVVGSAASAVVVLRSDAGGPRAAEVRALGAVYTSTAYTVSNGACSEYPKGAGYPLGEPIPLGVYAPLGARTGEDG